MRAAANMAATTFHVRPTTDECSDSDLLMLFCELGLVVEKASGHQLVGNQCNDSTAYRNEPGFAFVLQNSIEWLFDGLSAMTHHTTPFDTSVDLLDQSRFSNLDRRVGEWALQQFQQRGIEVEASNSFGSHGRGSQDFASMIHNAEFAPTLKGSCREQQVEGQVGS